MADEQELWSAVDEYVTPLLVKPDHALEAARKRPPKQACLPSPSPHRRESCSPCWPK